MGLSDLQGPVWEPKLSSFHTLQESNAHLCVRASNPRPLSPERDGVLLFEVLSSCICKERSPHAHIIDIIYESIFSL